MIKIQKVKKDHIEDIIALSNMQQGMLYHYLKDTQSDYYFEQLSLNIYGEIDFVLFEKAWNLVVEINEMLRTTFQWGKMKNPVQIILKEHTIKPRNYDFSNIDNSEKNKLIEEQKTKDRKEKFDLREVPFRITLCKIQESQYEIIVSNHHILYDGWSTGIILQEFFKAYDDLSNGREYEKPVKTKFKNFIKWIQYHDPEEREKFWRDYLRGVDTRTELPIKKAESTGNIRTDKETENYSFNLPFTSDKRSTLEAFIKNHKVTIASLFYCAWGILLQKYINSDDVIFGTTVSGRPANIKGIENVVGLFINTLPLRIERKPNETVLDLLNRINHIFQARVEYETTPITDLKEYIQWEHEGEIFDSILVIENYPLDIGQLQDRSSLKINSYSIVEAVYYDLTVSIQLYDLHNIEISFLYHMGVYDRDAIELLSRHFVRITQEILREPEKEPHQLEMMSSEEKQHILVDFNNTATDYPKDKTIHRLFEEQVEKTPDNIALEGVGQEREFIASVSYRALNKKASKLARVLRAKGVGSGSIVGIMIHRSIEMVFGILAILKNGSAYLPIDPDYPAERIHFMLMDSGSKFLLVGGNYGHCMGKGPKIINIGNDRIYREYTANPLPGGRYDDPIYVIYTSGTTGVPKGVLVNHINVVRLVKNTNYINFYPQDRLLQTGALEFDASTFEIWGTLLNGAGLVLVGKETMLNFVKLKGVIKKHKISIMWMTSPLFNQVADVELFAGLKKLLVGGDVLSPLHINRVGKAFPQLKIINGYGPTENTTFSTTYLIGNRGNKENQDDEERIPIGSPIANSTAYIIDKDNNLSPIGIPGELIVGGDGVARGYLNNPELTKDTFMENRFPKVKTANLQGDRLYKTGDLARWLPDGNIDFLGRADKQVKIKGFRVELEEIENQLIRHKDIKEAVVIVRSDKTGEFYLCAYLVPRSVSPYPASLKISRIRDYLSNRLPAYMVPPYFVILDRLPLTSNGKLDRKSLPGPGIISGKEYSAPRSEREEKLVKIWSEVLGIEKKKIGIDKNFFELGGHSLKATRLISQIHQVFDMEIPLGQLFQTPTIRQLSFFMSQGGKSRHWDIEPREKKEYYALSSAQERLLALQQFDTVGTTYNISLFAVLEGDLDRGRLETAFMKLLDRHESLRTSFEIIDRHPRQRVQDEVMFELEYYDAASSKGGLPSIPIIINNFIQSFDLSKPPLLRVGLIKKGDKRHIWAVDMHHIISDGISTQLLMEQFRAFYCGEELPALNIQYRDYCQWQHRKKESRKIEKQAAYWREQFKDEIPALDLPTDFTRPLVQRFEGSHLSFKISVDDADGLKTLAMEERVTLFTILLSVVNIFLAKLSSQEVIVLGTAVAGRRHTELEPVMGMFVNTLPLRNKVPGDETFRNFLRKVGQNTLAAFENQDYPFEELVEQVEIARDVSRNPLFDVMFLLQETDIAITEIESPIPARTEGLTLKPFNYVTKTSKFDLTIESFEVDEMLLLTFEYSINLFKRTTIERFKRYFKKIISGITGNSEIKLQDIEIISEREKQDILVTFNNTAADYPQDKSIRQLFAAQVERTPDHIALIGLGPKPKKVEDIGISMSDGTGTEKSYLTYKELDEKSDQAAHLLRRKGVQSDTIAVIMVNRSIEMMLGIFAILKAGGTYLPVDPDYPGERKRYIFSDSNVKVLVTTEILAKKVEMILCSKDINTIFIDNFEVGNFEKEPGPQPAPAPGSTACLAYIIYTSGSTGKPKGVMIEHKSLVNRLNWMQQAYPLGEEDVILQKTTVVFDVSVWELFWWSIQGASLCLLSPGGEKNPAAIISAIEQNKVTTIHFVPSMLTVFLDYLEGVGGGDLRIRAGCGVKRLTAHLATLKQVFSSGEALGVHQVVKFNKLLNEKNKTKLINLYGPTEATIDVSYFNCPREGEAINERSIPIGKPIENIRLYVIHKHNGLQPVGVPGELCIAGDGLARGYLNKPELTAEKFVEAPFLQGERIYKTGDLVRWMSDGNIEFLGRSDYQLKLRGFRIELGEIENHLLSFPGVKEALVTSNNDSRGDKYLCAYIVPYVLTSFEMTKLGSYLRERLPDYMVPAHFMKLAEMPLTPTGKIDRKSLPEPGLVSIKGYIPPRNTAEEVMRGIWAELLGINKEKIGIDDNFFKLGGHSLKVIRLISRVHEIFNIEIPMGEIFKTPTIRTLSQHLEKREKIRRQPIEPIEKREYYVLSSAQKRLYILQQLDKQGIAYNMPLAVKLEGNLDKDRLQKTFEKLIARHESLRTSLELVCQEPVQKVHDEVDFEIEGLPAGGKNKTNQSAGYSRPKSWELITESCIKDFIRPFDLSCAPLLRVGLIEIAAQTHILVMDMHHVISDGKSLGIVLDEFVALYPGQEFPSLKLQYKDYSLWQKSEFEQQKLKKQRAYWRKQFEGEVPVLDLPTDFPHPTVQDFAGSRFHFEIDSNTVRELRTLALQEGVTLFMTLLAAINVFLGKLAQHVDIVIGTAVAGRKHLEMENNIGMFVNTLALRNKISPGKTFKNFLEEVRENTLNAFENQDYPFEELAAQLELNRDMGRNPLFDVMFLLQNKELFGIEIGTPTSMQNAELRLQPYPYETHIAKFDLTLEAVEVEEKLLFTFEYCTKLFQKTTIQRFVTYFNNTIAGILESSRRKLADIEIISREDKQKILFDFNNTDIEYPDNKNLQQLFVEQAERVPHHAAVLGARCGAASIAPYSRLLKNDVSITYGELNRESGQLSRVLKEKGVTRAAIVPIIVDRSLEMLLGILGILKAGAAYLPIEPSYPGERIKYILKDSNAQLVLSQKMLAEELNGEYEVINPEDPGLYIGTGSQLESINTPGDPAYAIYTSGSTGNPKGLLLEHGSVVNLLYTLHQRYPLGESDAYLFKTPYVFDVSVTELFGWFLGGGRLKILEPGAEKDTTGIMDAVEREKVTHVNFVPSMFNSFVEQVDSQNIGKLSNLKYIFLAGEALLPELVNKFRALNANTRLENLYGPTEAAVYTSYYSLSAWSGGTVPIGKPMANVKLYILDKENHVVPVGVSGELCISGVGVARGYLNNPELTAEKFDQDLWDYQDFKKDEKQKINKKLLQGVQGDGFLEKSPPGRRRQKIYHTGDLACWLANGNIEFLGRNDEQVKIRGYRIELGEIENQLLNDKTVKKAVVIVRSDSSGDKYLCAYIVPCSPGSLKTPSLRNHLKEKLPGYMIPAHFVLLEEMPVTAAGKIDKKSLPDVEITSGQEYIAPRNEVEKALVKIWSEVLGTGKKKIGIDENFFELGGHSLKATVLTARINKKLNVGISLGDVFKYSTVRRLAHHVRGLARKIFAFIEPAEKKAYYPAASAQERLYILQQMDLESTVYNITAPAVLEGDVQKEKLEMVFQQLIQRHESLRTSFEIIENEPVQKIHDRVEFFINDWDNDSLVICEHKSGVRDEWGKRISNFVRPFDLSRVPLLRVGLINLERGKHILILDMHHIISDGTSIGLLVKDFMAFYSGEILPRLRLQYKDFSGWQNNLLTSGGWRSSEEYWLSCFSGDFPILDLPTDYPRPPVQHFEGNKIEFAVENKLYHQITRLIKNTETTLHMVLLAVYNVLLARYTGQEDIVVGTATAGRYHADQGNMIGLLLETLAIRSYPRTGKTFGKLLGELKERTLNAFEHQVYPFRELIKKVGYKKEFSRNPIFDVMLIVQNLEAAELEIEGLKYIPLDHETGSAKVDLTLEAVESVKSERIDLHVEYSTALFKRETIERFVLHFLYLLRQVVKWPASSGIKLADLDIMSEEERRQILDKFNAAVYDFDYSRDRLFCRQFEAQVEQTPDRAAVIGMGYCPADRTGESTVYPIAGSYFGNLQLTYEELNKKSNQLAYLLKSKGVVPDTIAGIMVDRSIEILIGILGILKAGGAYLPLAPEYPQDRIDYVLADSGASLLLSGKKLIGNTPFGGELIEMDSDEWRKSDASNLPNVNLPHNLAYIIYTSGSTGRPKGVMVEHRNLINYLHAFEQEFRWTRQDIIIQQASYAFDAFGEEIYPMLLKGGKVAVPGKSEITDVGLLSDFIGRHRVNIIDCSPLLLNELNKRPPLAELHTYISGGDQLKGEYITNLLRVGRVYNTYGPTEATICATYFNCSSHREVIDKTSNIPIGKPISNYKIYILDKRNMLLPVGIPGELAVSGDGVARGYLNNMELTAEKFLEQVTCAGDRCKSETSSNKKLLRGVQGGGFLEKSPPGRRRQKIYKTGDLVRWLPDGNIEFLGRIDLQVKIRGYRIELGEIESQLLKHEDIEEAVAVLREKNHLGKYIYAYFVAGGEKTVRELRHFLSHVLPDYMIPAYFVQLEQMPVTTSGKINRKLLPDPGDNILGTGIEYEAPVNETEGKLVNIWQEILHIEDSDRIGVLDDFFELGGDSLAANQVIARIRERLYVDISLRNFFEQPSIRALAGEVARSEKKVSVIGKARREGKIPLSFAQERLWFLQELDNENIAYHVPRVIRFDGELKVSLLERTLSEIIRRHEILRTVFPTVDGQPVQRILDPFDFQAPIVDFSYLCPEEQSIRVSQWIQEEGQREFDLEKGPMMRITLLKLNEKQHILGLTEHHLVHDGWTQGVLLNEFVTIFSAYALDRPSPLPELPIQYADFAIWQRNFLQGEILENHLDYWQKKLAGLPPVLELPTDRPRPPVISGKGGMKELWLSERLSNELSQFSKERGVTLFMTMLAVFKVFLYRYTGSQDLCIGTGMANRRYKELEGMLGMVINTLALRTQFSGEMSFEELLNHVRTTCLEAYEYEDTPFGKVVEVIRPERSLSYNPIVQVLFSFMDIPAVDFVLPGLEIRGEFPHNRSSKFDLAIIVVPPQEFQGEEHRSETLMEWEYSTDIFDDETIDRMLTHYLRLLENTLIAPREKISYLHLLNNEEIHQLLYQWNDTTASYPHRQTIHELFAIQAERTPDQMALVGVTGEIRKRRSEEEKKEEYPFGQFVNAFDEGHLSYCELNKRSGKVAELLIEKGVQPDTIVGIMVERSLEMVVGLLGILKAGSTYMPIDPDYPGERIDYMLTDSGAKILVSDRNVERIGHCPVHVLSALYSSPFERSARSSVNLAYVIYTSGSTGKPKGVLVQHMSVVNLAYSQKQYFKIDKEDRILLFSSICFDASVEQIFIALLSGAVLVVIDKATLLHGDRFDRFICRHAVTHIHAVPSFLNTIGLKRWSHLKRMISGGDVCPAMLVKQWRPYCDFYNEYGPTETTVTSTEILVKDVNDHSGRLPIGKPINNTFIYLLNSGMNLVPLGVPGDLYIGGDGLARGYLNRPELSAEKFIFVSSVAKKIYQSGDLARWLRGGIIEFLGRQDQQVKIRGFRVELEEIEKQLLTHKIVKEAVVIVSTNEKTDKYICAYIVPDSIGDWNVSQLREHLSGKLPAYMIPTYFVSLERIPLNPNGKIDRQALPNPLEGGALKQSQVVYVAPRNELEEKIAHIWSDILNIEYNAVGIDSNFFELGGHSLNATLLTARIHKISNVRVPLKELFIRPSIRELVLYIEGSVEEKYRPIEICEEREYYELSSAQRRVYIEQQVEHDSTSYNMRFILQLAGHLDREKLQTTFRQLIKRHESFRTSFEMSDYRPVQRIYSPDDISFDIEYYRVDSREKDISAAVEQVITNFIRPFELSSPPLLRVGLVEKGPDTYVLMVEVSHIIGDGTSMEVLLADFASLYKGEQLPSLQLSYRDFSQWHNRLLSSGHMKKQEIYWLERFKDPALILNMPLDFPRPAVWSGEGGSLNFQLDREFITRIRDLSVETGTTLYVILLAVVNIILFIYTGQGDITVGSPMAGRVHANIERLIGIFVNMLAMRNHPTEEKTVEEFLEEVKKNTFDAFANQEYPFENLVRKLGRRPAAGRNNPLFDVVLAVQNMPVGDMKIENLQVTPYEDTRLTMNQYDLLIQAVEGKDTIDMRLEYSISLFKPPTAEQIVKHFIEVLKQVVDHQDMKLKDIAISQHLLAAQPGILHDDDSDFRL